MKESINLSWLKDMSFETEVHGHKLYLDASAEHGGKNLGPRPKALMLVALAGCTAMDVVSILAKMRVAIDKFNIHVDADLTDEHPRVYSKMKLVYEFAGKDLPIDKLQKAVDLSRERYCGVSAMYKQVMELEFEIRILD
jgi:putative redox protein